MIKRHFDLMYHPAPLKTSVHMGNELLYSSEWIELIRSYKRRVAVVTDAQVSPLIAEKWVAMVQKQGIDATLFSFAGGEESKTRQTKEQLEDEMLQSRLGRDTVLIAIGGGVVTDLGGYLASTYLRGIPLVLIPTTLLGMVDAAIGGKTGVNTPLGKNLIGTFYPAEHLLIDTSLLATLPTKEFRHAAAEVIKYGLISSGALIDKLAEQIEAWRKGDPAFVQEVIYDCISIKAKVIEADFQEKGLRRILNFGHTVAHAIEACEHYQIPHGEAVAMGMLAEAYLSHRFGCLSKEEWEKIERVLTLFDFPFTLSSSTTLERLISAMSSDKKAKNLRPRFVLLEQIGKVASFDEAYCTEVDETLLKEAIHLLGRR